MGIVVAFTLADGRTWFLGHDDVTLDPDRARAFPTRQAAQVGAALLRRRRADAHDVNYLERFELSQSGWTSDVLDAKAPA